MAILGTKQEDFYKDVDDDNLRFVIAKDLTDVIAGLLQSDFDKEFEDNLYIAYEKLRFYADNLRHELSERCGFIGLYA